MSCIACIILKKFIEADHVLSMIFGRSNHEFDQVRLQNIEKGETPSLEVTIFFCQAEESRQCVILDKQPSLDALALAIEKDRNNRRDNHDKKDYSYDTRVI